MATFTKFHSFSEALAEGKHDLGSDNLVVALTNSAPSASGDDTLADISQISYTNTSSRAITTTSSSQTSGTYKLVLADLVLEATGSVGPFRYVVIYNDSADNDELIGYSDYASAVTMANGDTFTIDFDASNGAIAIT